MEVGWLHKLRPGKLLHWLPSVCSVCRRSICEATSLCPDCEESLPWILDACVQCGEATGNGQLVDDRCGRCLARPPPFRHCRGMFHYTGPIRPLLANFKFHGQLEQGFCLSNLLAQRLRACWRVAGKPELLVPVPLHRRRLRQRGFNQALEIARVIATRCEVPLARAVIRRHKATAPQTSLSSSGARRDNLKRAFSVTDRGLLQSVNSVAIVDDVVTTMATVSEMAKLLKRHGIQRVEVVCLARANPGDP